MRAADDTSEQPVARPTVDAGVFHSMYAQHSDPERGDFTVRYSDGYESEEPTGPGD